MAPTVLVTQNHHANNLHSGSRPICEYFKEATKRSLQAVQLELQVALL